VSVIAYMVACFYKFDVLRIMKHVSALNTTSLPYFIFI